MSFFSCKMEAPAPLQADFHHLLLQADFHHLLLHVRPIGIRTVANLYATLPTKECNTGYTASSRPSMLSYLTQAGCQCQGHIYKGAVSRKQTP